MHREGGFRLVLQRMGKRDVMCSCLRGTMCLSKTEKADSLCHMAEGMQETGLRPSWREWETKLVKERLTDPASLWGLQQAEWGSPDAPLRGPRAPCAALSGGPQRALYKGMQSSEFFAPCSRLWEHTRVMAVCRPTPVSHGEGLLFTRTTRTLKGKLTLHDG